MPSCSVFPPYGGNTQGTLGVGTNGGNARPLGNQIVTEHGTTLSDFQNHLHCACVTTDQEARKLFDEAAAIVGDEILLHERQRMAAPGWFLRRRLKRALRLFNHVLELKPQSWNSMWLIAKVHQRLGDLEHAFSWMERAYQSNPSQLDVAREASLIAMDLGRKEAAVVYAYRATQIEKENAGLMANLALAYLLANDLAQARATIARSLEMDPADGISKTIEGIIAHFEREKKTPPCRTEELQKYWAGLPQKK